MFHTLSSAFSPRKPLRRIRRAPSLAASILAALALPAHSQDVPETPYDVVSLSVEADTEVDNDLMRATLVVQAEAEEPAALADTINATMRWALDALETYPGITRETRDYSTWPRHDTSQRQRLIGWRGSQSLVLESDDFTALGKALQTLQERLQVQRTELAVSPETGRAAADALIDEALDAFGRRAARVADKLGASGYRILELDVRSESSGFERRMDARVRAMDTASSAVAEPAIAGGTSRLAAYASGRIRLQRAAISEQSPPGESNDER